MGLWLGVSVITIFEYIQFIFGILALKLNIIGKDKDKKKNIKKCQPHKLPPPIFVTPSDDNSSSESELMEKVEDRHVSKTSKNSRKSKGPVSSHSFKFWWLDETEIVDFCLRRLKAKIPNFCSQASFS